MSALDITSKDKIVTVSYEEKTKEKVLEYLDELQRRLNTTRFGLCPLFCMEPTESATRAIRRWYSNSEKDFQPMPEHHWRMLLILLNGQSIVLPV